MNEEDKVENEETAPTAVEPSQEKDPIQEELDRLEDKKPKRTRLETLAYNRDRLDKELAEERKKLGITDEDDRPLTRGDLKVIQQESAQETAFKLADEITDDAEKKLVKYHLENTIKPSGDASTDLRNARLIVNSVKNGQIAEEAVRSVKARTSGSSSGAPAKEKQVNELTTDEKKMMSGFGLTEEQVIAARPKE